MPWDDITRKQHNRDHLRYPGRHIYFTFNRGNYSGLREYYVASDTKTNDAVDVTAHVPSYVPRDINKMSASSSEDVIALTSAREPNHIYLYKFYWNDGEKLQSAWSRWTFPATDQILSVEFVESDLFVVIRRSDGVYIESFPINPGYTDEDFTFGLHIDRRVTEARCLVSYDPSLNRTFITPPYQMLPGEVYRVVTRGGNTSRKIGEVLPYTVSGNTLSVPGAVTRFYLGRDYVMRYKFSTFVIKEEAIGGGQIMVGEGRIQLRKANLTYDKSGYFRVQVTPFRRDPYTYVFSGRVIGSARNIIGEVAIEAGRFTFPIMARNDTVDIEIINDSHMPCAFLGAEWEAIYVIRSKRL